MAKRAQAKKPRRRMWRRILIGVALVVVDTEDRWHAARRDARRAPRKDAS